MHIGGDLDAVQRAHGSIKRSVKRIKARMLERPPAGRSYFHYILTCMICWVARLFSAANPIT